MGALGTEADAVLIQEDQGLFLYSAKRNQKVFEISREEGQENQEDHA